jgi:hypothetical protein
MLDVRRLAQRDASSIPAEWSVAMIRVLFGTMVATVFLAQLPGSLASAQHRPALTLPPNTSLVRQSGWVHVYHHRNDNYTAVNLAFLPIWRDKLGRIEIFTEFSSPGTVIAVPDTVELRFDSHARRDRFTGTTEVGIQCGVDVRHILMKRHISSRDSFDQAEHLWFDLSYADFEAVAQCPSAQFSIGDLYIPVSADLRTAYETMLAEIKR